MRRALVARPLVEQHIALEREHLAQPRKVGAQQVERVEQGRILGAAAGVPQL